MKPALTICIPTYNRLPDLRECLAYLYPQVEIRPAGEVTILVVDNASTPEVEAFLRSEAVHHPVLSYRRNPVNLGFDGNCARCVELSDGKYTALLSDDDRYMPGMVAEILRVINQNEYSLIYLNGYPFMLRPEIPIRYLLAENDIDFARGNDIMNYPTVGHFSCFVYRTAEARQALAQMVGEDIVAAFSTPDQSRARGTFLEIAIRVTSASSLPSFLMGKRLLAGKVRVSYDHCGVGYGINKINELCLGYYKYMLNMHEKGLLSDADMDYRRKVALASLPKVLLQSLPFVAAGDREKLVVELDSAFGGCREYRVKSRPLIVMARYAGVKGLYRVLARCGSYGALSVRFIRSILMLVFQTRWSSK